MRKYIPDKKPKAKQWLALPEEEQYRLVEEAHAGIDLDEAGKRIHAAVHVTVENQLAMRVAEVVEAYERLRKGGLDRHESVHAIGSVLIEQLYEVRAGQKDEIEYLENLRTLTAQGWLESYEER